VAYLYNVIPLWNIISFNTAG